MLTLNLVSQELKQEIKLRNIYKIFKRMGYIIVFITLVIAICLFSAKTILKKNLSIISEQTSLVKSTNSGYNIKVKKINSQLNSVINIQKDFNKWSAALKYITDKCPAGIKMSYIKINKDSASIKIGGKSDTRENLLVFKDNLINSKILTDIDLPTESLLNKENINFDINGKINLSEIDKLN